jgi:hypothetical protein
MGPVVAATKALDPIVNAPELDAEHVPVQVALQQELTLALLELL